MTNALPLIAITAALSAMMLAIIWSLRRCGLPGVHQWWLSNMTVTLGLVLVALRGVIPDLLSVVVANPMLAWGMALFHAGTMQFCGRPAPWRTLVAGTLAVLAGIVFWRYVYDDFNMRVFVVSGFHSLLCGWTAVVLWRFRPTGRAAPYHLVTAAFAVFFAVGHAIRGIWSLLASVDSIAGTAPPGLNVAFIALGALVMPAMGMGAVLMIHDAMIRRLETIANTDFLTGVLSRKAFEDIARSELQRAPRAGHGPSILIVDIDRFKSVNDCHGHAAGDIVLAQFARCASESLRAADHIGRLGGEEFVILLPGTGWEAAGRVAERLRAEAGCKAVTGAFGSIHYTVSGGYATWQYGESLEQLCARADAALYTAKLAGRNRVHGHPGEAGTATPGAAWTRAT